MPDDTVPDVQDDAEGYVALEYEKLGLRPPWLLALFDADKKAFTQTWSTPDAQMRLTELQFDNFFLRYDAEDQRLSEMAFSFKVDALKPVDEDVPSSGGRVLTCISVAILCRPITSRTSSARPHYSPHLGHVVWVD
eukprot:3626111-Prymnesium_polylepis.1